MRNRVFIVGLISLVTLGLFYSTYAAQQQTKVLSDSTISVTVGTDACPNIAGWQSSVPSGMAVDGSGNCYTPAPPPPDLCNNIAGTQATVPTGYYRTGGNCFPIPPPPAPPIDVCPNLAGTQTSVPSGYILNESGNCIIPPIDLCKNIPGTQTTVPGGLTLTEDDQCITPPAEPEPEPDSAPVPVPAPVEDDDPPQSIAEAITSWFAAPATPRQPIAETPGGPVSPGLANVPQALRMTTKEFAEAVPEPIKNTVRSLPPVVAYTFPYYVFAALGAVAAILWFQAAHEIAMSAYFAGLLRRQRSIAEQKDNFVALASHYLRTPQTVMANGLDTLESLKEASPENIAAVRKPVQTLGANISAILDEVQNNSALSQIETPDNGGEQKNFLRSAHFWWPVATSLVVVLGANFLLGVVGEVEIGLLNQIAQVIVFVAVLLVFYSALRNHFVRKRTRAQHQELVDHETTVDEARNEFLKKATTTLQLGLNDIYAQRPYIADAEHVQFFDDGYTRFLAILNKFNLLAQIRAGTPVQIEPFELHSSIDATLAKYRPVASEKNIAITNGAPTTTVSQHRQLFEFVLDSLVDNAIKFTPEGGAITIGAKPGEKLLSVTVADSGTGIPKEKQTQLFQPFSRTESAVEFNYEGLGFSLFLDKIIMEYIGGDINVSSEQDQGSTFTLSATTQPDSVQPANNFAIQPQAG